MSLIDELKDLGINVEEALNRFMGNSSLYERMLGKLTAAVSENEVMPCFEAGNNEAALEKAHTIKGVTGNLSITPLYEAYSDIVSLLRAGKPSEAKAVLENILPVQENIISCIESHR